MIKKNEYEVDTEQTKNRIDFTFYSNALQISRTELDLYIDFSQYPPDENNNVSSVRIYMPHEIAKELSDILEKVLVDLNKLKEEQ